MTKTLYLIRHGQTLFNVQDLNQGACDGPLTNLGVAQAQEAGRLLADRHVLPDHVFSSPSERACDTCEIVTGFLGEGGPAGPGAASLGQGAAPAPLPYERVDDLRELNLGVYEGKSVLLNPPYPFDDHFVQFGGEDMAHLAARVEAVLTQVMLRENVQVAMAFSHGCAIESFLRLALPKSGDFQPVEIKHCSVVVLRFDEESQTFSLVEVLTPDVDPAQVDNPSRVSLALTQMSGDLAARRPDGDPLDPAPAEKSFWLVRHAETLFNAQGKTQGWCDSPVTPRGHQQAQICGRMLAELGANPDHAFCSTAERTAITLEHILSELGKDDLPYLQLKGIRENGFGFFEAKDNYLEPDHMTAPADFYVPFGGEDKAKIADRFAETLAAVMGRPDVGEAVFVSHGGASVTFFFSDYVRREADLPGFSNCMAYHYRYLPAQVAGEPGTFVCDHIHIPDFSAID